MDLTNRTQTLELITRLALLILLTFLIIDNFSTSTDSFLRLTILIGFMSGFLRFHKHKLTSSFLSLLAAVLIPIILMIIISSIKQIRLSLLPLLLWPGVSLLSYSIGLLIKFLKVKTAYKKAFILGIFVLMILAASRRYSEGHFAVITILSYVLASYSLSFSISGKSFPTMGIFNATPLFFILLFSDKSGLILTLPTILFAIVLSFISINAFMKFEGNNFKKYTPLIFVFLSSPFIWIIQENYSIWHYSAGNSIPVDTVSITIYNKDKGIISENNNSTSVYLFWSASCSSCKKEFPYFSELALNYKDRKDIHFYTVLLEFNESDSVAFNREIRNNSHFKWAYALNGKVLYDRLKMNGVPHITIIDSQNNIRYNGRVSNRPWLYINHPDRFL